MYEKYIKRKEKHSRNEIFSRCKIKILVNQLRRARVNCPVCFPTEPPGRLSPGERLL